jgi:hypothetical protein
MLLLFCQESFLLSQGILYFAILAVDASLHVAMDKYAMIYNLLALILGQVITSRS